MGDGGSGAVAQVDGGTGLGPLVDRAYGAVGRVDGESGV